MIRWLIHSSAILVYSAQAFACNVLLGHKINAVSWLPQPHEVRIIASSRVPDSKLVTGVYVLIFDNDGNLLLGHRRNEKVWDLVGGHVDAEDISLEMAVRREAYEEIGVRLRDLHAVAFEEIILKGSKPEGYKYPFPKSYQVFYVARVERLDAMPVDEDTDQRAWFTPAALESVPWAIANPQVIDYARRFTHQLPK